MSKKISNFAAQNCLNMDTNLGFVRVAAAVPTLRVADCKYNAEQIRLQIDEAIAEGVEVVCFPELSLTGYTCADLFFTQALQQSAMRELEALCDYTRGKSIIVLVGAPLKVDNDLFNCAREKMVHLGSCGTGVYTWRHRPAYSEDRDMEWRSTLRNGPALHNPQLHLWCRDMRGLVESAASFDPTGYPRRGVDLQPLELQLRGRQACFPSPNDHAAECARALWLYIHFLGCGRVHDRCGLLR